ncbi:MAG: AI-2E family transporter [Bacillota bacterium]
MLTSENRYFKMAVVILAFGLVSYFIYQIKVVLIPFMFGIILAYLFNPFIILMEDRNFSRRGAILLLSIILFNIIFIAGLFLFPLLLEELQKLAQTIPEYINIIDRTVSNLSEQYQQLTFPPLIKDSFDRVLTDVEKTAVNYIHQFTEMLFISLPVILSLFISPVITYYLLKDKENIKETLAHYIPLNDENFCYQMLEEINHIFVNYLRGQVWISIIVAFLIGLGLLLMKVKFFIIFALLAGITNVVPYFGPILGGLPVVFVTFLVSPLRSVGVIILYILVQQLESILITPRIMSENVGLHPLTIIFALLAGAELLGIWGLLLGIPAAASMKVILSLLLE